MSLLLKQSTAVTVKVGPFVDQTDGFTAEDALTIAQADVRLSKNGGNMAQKNESTTLAFDEIGMYDCLLDATDTNTLGILTLNVHEAGARPVKQEYLVVPANVWDSLCGADLLQVDSTQLLGTAYATPTVAGVQEVDQTHILGTALATPTVAGVQEVDVTHLNGVAQSLLDLKQFADDAFNPATNKILGVVTADSAADLGSDAQDKVKAQVMEWWETETYAELGQVALTYPLTPSSMFRWMFKRSRNKTVHNRLTGMLEVYNDNAATVDQKQLVSDTGGATGAATIGEVAVGP